MCMGDYDTLNVLTVSVVLPFVPRFRANFLLTRESTLSTTEEKASLSESYTRDGKRRERNLRITVSDHLED
jgi:hypothetical protein